MNPDITVAAILRQLESICPMALAESWDNVGLLWGDPGPHNVLIAEGQGPMTAGWLHHMFKGKIIVAGGCAPDTAGATVEHGDADLVAFGRLAWLIRTCPSASPEVCLSTRMIARPSTRAVLKATSTTRSLVSRRRRWREHGGSVSNTLEWRSL